MIRFKDYIQDICQFYRDNGLQIDPVPKLSLNKRDV